MKRFFPVFLALLLFIAPALADPLVLQEDLTADINEPYDEGDPSAGTFAYSCRYPRVDETTTAGIGINAFYEYLYNDTLDNYVTMIQEAYEGEDFSMNVTYTVTCNNDDFFSVLLRTERNSGGQSQVYCEGNVFLRDDPNPGFTSTLPQLLGILDADENDTWYQDRQTGKADGLLREMVWDLIEENEAGIEYYPDLTEETLSNVFFPEEGFYLDADGTPVFFLNPGVIAPPEYGLLTYRIPLEDILDEM